jgi:23S rRNA (guanine745-N1)-methyltransferase
MNIIWCVADLTNIPFKNKQFDIVLNILSPSSYKEFHRILKDDGILIKVVPGSDYLVELRSIFYGKTDKEIYSNDRVIKLFTQNFNMVENRRVTYNVTLCEENTEHLLKMTPLTWNIQKETMLKVIKTGIKKVTADFHIIIGKK